MTNDPKNDFDTMCVPCSRQTDAKKSTKIGAVGISFVSSTMSAAASSGVTSEGPTTTGVSESSTDDDKCGCSWPNCVQLRREILQKLPEDHPWRGPILQIQSHGDTNRKIALMYSVAHHLKYSEKDRKKKTYRVHCHHFSLLGWSNSKSKTTLLDEQTAIERDKHIGRREYHDKVNTLEHIMLSLGRKMTKQDVGMYVEAPIVTRADVKVVLDSVKKGPSKRAMPMAKRVSESTPLPSSIKKKLKSVSTVTPGTKTPALARSGCSAVATTPTASSALVSLDQASPPNPLYPSLDSITDLLSYQYFVRFNGDSEAFF